MCRFDWRSLDGALRGTLTVLAAVVGVALSVGTAQATDLHKPLFQISEVPAEGPSHEPVGLPGPLHERQGGGFGSMSVAMGHLWLAGQVERNPDEAFRVDEFDAATGAFVSQLAYSERTGEASATPEYQAIAAGKLPGETQARVYLVEGAVVNGFVAPSIGVYSESGSKLGEWTGAGTPAKSFGSWDGGGGTNPTIAVDGSESLTDWAAGDVFLANNDYTSSIPNVVDVFHPGAGTNGEEKYVTQLTGISPTEQFSLIKGVTVNDVNGDVIVSEGGRLDLFEPTAFEHYVFVRTLTLPRDTVKFEAESVDANDGEGDIYAVGQVSEEGVSAGTQVFEFNAAGEFEGKLPVPSNGQVGVAADPETHGVFVSVSEGAAGVYAFGPNIVIPNVATGGVSTPKPNSVTLNGTIDPDGAGAAECQFVWGTTSAYGQVAACPDVPEGNGPVARQASLTGLAPDTTYHYRLQATNVNGTNAGEPWEDHEFKTPGPGIRAESVVNVSATSATLQATIDPNHGSTSYYFQYGTSGEYGQESPLAPGEMVGSGATDVEVPGRFVQGLSPATVYHYRVIAIGEIGPGEFETILGEDHTFVTQAAGGSFALADGRQWELVSPADKLGALIEGFGFSAHVMQVSVEGNAIAYAASSPTESEPHGGYTKSETVLSTRGAGGWSSQDISAPHVHAVHITSAAGHEYQIFSEDLSRAAVEPVDSLFTPLSPEASESTPYLRSDYLGGNLEDHCTSDCYRPLVTGKQGFADVLPGTVFGGEPNGVCEIAACGPLFQGATPDLSHVVLSSPARLTSTPAPVGGPGLYEWSDGSLQLLDVLPEGEEGPAVLAGSGDLVGARNSISEDGERVVMEGGATQFRGTTNGKGLYLREVVSGSTIRLDVPQGGIGPSEDASYMGASGDASRIFFLDSGRLMADSSPSGEDLYEYNLNAPAGSRLSDLTVDPQAGRSADVVMMLGASKDGSYVYFVAAGALVPGAVEGQNLYVRHEGVTQLIAALPSDETFDWSRQLHGNYGSGLYARVSPNGRWLAFLSSAELTGYDTRDAVSGQPDLEVYLYHAPQSLAPESGTLICASCDPTGARPVGVKFEDGTKPEDGSEFIGRWVAASVPEWTGSPEPGELGGSFAVHQPRYLSDSGRLFFDSSDALVSQDVDGTEDVYEYEPAGVGDCSSPSVTFAQRSGGCVNLVSAGISSVGSTFLDASETGGDVFFMTQARLAVQDYDTATDVYDAHECTGVVPCFPAVNVPPPCDTEASCRVAPTPQPALYGAPASATFSGTGNFVPAVAPVEKPKTKPKPKKQVKCAKHGAKSRCAKEKTKPSKRKRTKAVKSRRGDNR